MLGKFAGIILIIILIAVSAFGYVVYQRYSPLAELAECGKNCIDYKKVKVLQQETPVPDIKIIEADAEKLTMDVPIIIHNPSTKNTEILKIDFDAYMEGRHLTKGTLPSHELPAKQNTTIWIKDVVIKYEELGQVLQVVAARHGAEMVKKGRANISMTINLLIYFPIKISAVNVYIFKIPMQIETEVPIDMLKQKGEAEKQIEETIQKTVKDVGEEIKQVLPTSTPERTPQTPTETVLPLSTPTLPPPTPMLTPPPTLPPPPRIP